MDQDHKDPNKPQDDNPIKQAAMATFGAISSAFEKAAEVIGDAVSKENREKYAKKAKRHSAPSRTRARTCSTM